MKFYKNKLIKERKTIILKNINRKIYYTNILIILLKMKNNRTWY